MKYRVQSTTDHTEVHLLSVKDAGVYCGVYCDTLFAQYISNIPCFQWKLKRTFTDLYTSAFSTFKITNTNDFLPNRSNPSQPTDN